MKVCEKCAVSVSGGFEKCPLCQGALVGDAQDEYEIFPLIPLVINEHSLLFRLLLLGSAAVVIVSLTVNWMLPQRGFWSLFVIMGVACVWIGLLTAIRKRHNILKHLSYQVTIIGALSVLWDIFTGWRGWSVDYVVPIAFASVMTATAILAHILKMPTETYMVYSVLLIFYGIIPVIFVLSGLSTVVYPSLICVAGSLLSLAALLIFEGGNMREELKRRLHL
jgi:hypothetical protein